MDTELLELRERVMVARQKREPLELRGAGTKSFYRNGISRQTTPLTPLDVRGYRGIIDYEPSELVISARCGTPLSEIEAALETSGQFFGFEPPAFGADPTIGGVIAAGLSGPRRFQAGAARDFILGATLLAGDGELLRFGGRVMKNVAGFDLSRLLCGSLGIFGILSEVSLKVLPRPRAETTLRLEFSAPEALEAFNRWAGKPLPLSGAAWHGGVAWVRLSGATPAVRTACATIGGDEVDAEEASAWWSSLRHFTLPFFANTSLWRVSVPSTAPLLEVAGESLIDWGGALRWHAGELEAPDVRALATELGGTAMRWRGDAPRGRFHPLPPAVATIHRRLKESFDPEGIFNPGYLLAEL